MSPAAAFRAGVREVLPLAAGAGIFGLAYGVLAAQAGIGSGTVGALGVLVFAGSAQAVVTQGLAAGMGAVVALAGLALNLRLLLVAASVRDVFAGRPLWQVALGAHLLTDENWALLLAERARGRSVGYWYLLGGGVCVMVAWVGGGVAGASFAGAIPSPAALGTDFAFTAAFIAIARSLWRGWRDLLPWIVSAASVALATRGFGVAPSWSVILGGLLGAASAAAWR